MGTSMGEDDAVPSAAPLPEDWPVEPAVCLARNHMGSFDWDLARDLMYLDSSALAVFDLRPEEYDLRPSSLNRRVPRAEADRLDELVRKALRDGSSHYGAYFCVRRRDGRLRWTHTQGHIHRDTDGRPLRVVGIVRDASAELAAPVRQPVPEPTLDDTSPAGAGEDGGEAERRGSLVSEITQALSRATTVDDVRDALAGSRGIGRLGAASLVLALVEAGRVHTLRVNAASPLINPLEHTRLDDRLPMAETIRTQTPRFVTSRREFAAEYPRLWQYFEPLGLGSAAYLPLTAQARPLGGLGLLFDEERSFPPDERDLLLALASAVAQSLQRAMLLEQEHQLAEDLQRAMLPGHIPDVPGARIAVRYRSAGLGRDIGGDWYDVIPLPGGRVVAVIGDVEGHDTQAAAVMGQLRIVLRAYASEGHPAPVVMARASAFLHELETERFATCLYAEHDPATGWLRLVRAGHLAPLVRRADGTTHRLSVRGTLPLGVGAVAGYPPTPVNDLTLARGETLLMCTDGLVEQHGADLDEGIDRVTRALREGPEDLEELADWITAAGVDDLTEDDMALVMLRRALD
ncbi:SpoIIE family protein phosphatase [Streptomyces sp. 4N509B]|uniref:SpoIIE family protein phosphatase n=1 Tax=Streptomyces sp. 4N509B TaxID=3457413 RepID=UPI003FD2AD7D